MDILFESNDILVINKPSGMMVHPDGKKDSPTVTDWVVAQYPSIKGVGEPARFDEKEIDRPGIVHRLDEETSGVLIIAKTAKAFTHLKEQFMNRTVEKEYHAFVWGHFKEASGIVDVPIGRSANDFRRRLAGRGARGELKEARTEWLVAEQFVDINEEQFSFMHLFPKTGRTHQLRVHMKYLQRPIVSDHLYAPTKPDALGFTRVALHARTVTFLDLSGSHVSVTAPYPGDFEQALAKYIKS